MKHECGSCEAVMTFQGVEGAPGESLRIAFGCPHCGHRIFLITNSQEAQLVRSMGITLGEMKEHQPLELVRSTLKRIKEDLSAPSSTLDGTRGKAEDGPVWDDDAEDRLEKAPGPVRAMARMAIERYAREKGHKRVTLQMVLKAREKMGL